MLAMKSFDQTQIVIWKTHIFINGSSKSNATLGDLEFVCANPNDDRRAWLRLCHGPKKNFGMFNVKMKCHKKHDIKRN